MISKYYEINKFKKKLIFFYFMVKMKVKRLMLFNPTLMNLPKKILLNMVRKKLLKIINFYLKIFIQDRFLKMKN